MYLHLCIPIADEAKRKDFLVPKDYALYVYKVHVDLNTEP